MRHAVITFLEDEASFNGVDPEFRGLVKLLHQIPYCATFGVSCAGHCKKNEDRFLPVLYGRLNIIVSPAFPHISALLGVLQKIISDYSDTSFRKTKHVFGPPENSRLQVWEIRINDNHCLDELRPDYCFGFLEIAQHKALYGKARQRYAEIKSFWLALEKAVSVFCWQYNFQELALEQRIEELIKEWHNTRRKTLDKTLKAEITQALCEKSDDFKWESFTTGFVLSRDELVAAIEEDTEAGRQFIALAERFAMDPDAVVANDAPNALGKRHRCDECGTELLVTKAGNGRVYCCDQMTELQRPKPLPSSD